MKLKRLLTAALSAVMALSVCALPAMADDSGTATTTPKKKTASVIDTDKTGSITIYKYNTTTATAQGDTGTGETQTPPAGATALRGAEFTIYQVKDETWLAKYYGGEVLASGEKTPEVDDCFKKDPTSGQVTSYEAANLVDSIAANAKGTKVTDENGYAKFDNLALGLYLVIETKVPQSVVTAVTPFLVSVPMTRVQTGDTATEGQLKEWLYDVTVYPKNSTVKGTIYLEKKGVIGNDKDHETALPGVKFKLERLNDGVELTKAVDTDWTLIKPAKKGTEEQKEYFVTGSEGKIEVADLTPGTYRFTELGYETNQDNKYIVNGGDRYVFVVGKDGKTVSKPTDVAYTSNGDYEVNNATTGTVTVYNYAPDVDKQVQKHGDASAWQDAADYNVGDKIPYKITVTVPENIARLKTFVVKDTPTNLDDDKDSIQVQYVDSTGTTTLNQGTSGNPGKIKEMREIVGSNNDKGFEIEFNPAQMATYAGKKIVITYSATLKDTAVSTTAGNTNKVSLIYSNKVKTDNTPETKDDKKQVQDETVVYTFKIKINKTNEGGTGLNDVEFDLYKEVPAGTTNAITGNPAKALGLDITKSWLKVNEQPLKTKTVGSEDGILEVNGLANGTYKIVETKTLKDYNLLNEPVDVTLSIAYKTTWTKTDTYNNGVWVKTEVKKAQEDFTTGRESTNGGTQSGVGSTGMITKTIINRKGFNLPVTGGFGTLLFSGIGVLLVLAGVSVLFSLKKKNNRA